MAQKLHDKKQTVPHKKKEMISAARKAKTF